MLSVKLYLIIAVQRSFACVFAYTVEYVQLELHVLGSPAAMKIHVFKHE